MPAPLPPPLLHHHLYNFFFLNNVREGLGVVTQQQRIVNRWPRSRTIGQSLRAVFASLSSSSTAKMNTSQVCAAFHLFLKLGCKHAGLAQLSRGSFFLVLPDNLPPRKQTVGRLRRRFFFVPKTQSRPACADPIAASLNRRVKIQKPGTQTRSLRDIDSRCFTRRLNIRSAHHPLACPAGFVRPRRWM